MGITTEITTDYHSALAALAWQLDMGVDEAMGDTPQSAYDLPDKAEWQKTAVRSAPTLPRPERAADAAPAMIHNAPSAAPDAAIDAAKMAAQRCNALDDLHSAMQGFDHLEIKKGARNFVSGAGNPNARIFILGDSPNREDEQNAKPFAGIAGQLLDRMFAAIGFGRENPEHALYLACALPWRTPQDRAPLPDEIATMRPFVQRQIELIAPEVIVVMGNTALEMAINTTGIARARGTWARAFGTDVMPMLAPVYLLENPAAKRDAWADLLAIKVRLT